MNMMTIEKILIREFHLKYPNAKSIEADDETMTSVRNMTMRSALLGRWTRMRPFPASFS